MGMNPEIKAKWLAALRSGDYQQTQGQLRKLHVPVMCCLGVLCDVVDPSGWQARAYVVGDDYDVARPPKAIMQAARLPVLEASILMRMNDQDGNSFTEIADWIERNL